MTEIDAIGSLAEPMRRALYAHVVAQDGPVSRAEAAEAVGVPRNLASFHLDKLVEAGLLEVTWQKLTGRQGPGSGRPAKLYRRAARQHSVHLPPRDYQTAARLLAEAVERTGADEALYAAARGEGGRHGAALARSVDAPGLADVAAALRERGYEPALEADGDLVLRNCPFHVLASEYPPLACGMNLAMLEGLLSGAGVAGYTASMRPAAERCCVVISKTKNC